MPAKYMPESSPYPLKENLVNTGFGFNPVNEVTVAYTCITAFVVRYGVAFIRGETKSGTRPRDRL